MDKTQVLCAVRFTAWALMAAKAALAGYVYVSCDLRRPIGHQLAWYDESRKEIFLGMTLMPAGWCLHQIYWWLAEISRVRHSGAMVDYMTAQSVWTIIPYAIIFFGCILIFSGFLRHLFGVWWFTVGLGFVLCLLTVGAFYAQQ